MGRSASDIVCRDAQVCRRELDDLSGVSDLCEIQLRAALAHEDHRVLAGVVDQECLDVLEGLVVNDVLESIEAQGHVMGRQKPGQQVRALSAVAACRAFGPIPCECVLKVCHHGGRRGVGTQAEVHQRLRLTSTDGLNQVRGAIADRCGDKDQRAPRSPLDSGCGVL